MIRFAALSALLAVALAVQPAGLDAAQPDYGPFRAEVLRVIDGDTIEMRVYLWPGLEKRVKVRLAGVDAPETWHDSPAERARAAAATVFAERFLARAGEIELRDVRLGKYAGRVIGCILADGRNMGEALLAAGLAELDTTAGTR